MAGRRARLHEFPRHAQRGCAFLAQAPVRASDRPCGVIATQVLVTEPVGGYGATTKKTGSSLAVVMTVTPLTCDDSGPATTPRRFPSRPVAADPSGRDRGFRIRIIWLTGLGR